MKTLTKNESIFYFLFGCIPVRLLLVYLAYSLSKENLKLLSVILFTIGISFIYLFITNIWIIENPIIPWIQRKNAPEAGGETWWIKYRIIHGLLYLISAVNAYNGENIAGLFLLIDTVIGLLLFINKRSK
jgi:hypothetical protein